MASSPPKILLTGSPGCGKTTLLIRVAEQLADRRLAGFYTQELRRRGRRVGFEAVTFEGQRAVLAHHDFQDGPRLGRYRVNLAEFDPLVQSQLDRASKEIDLFLIDEIGKMECFSRPFVELVHRALESAVPLLATVAQKGRGLMSEVKNRRDVELLTVTAETRARMVEQLVDRLRPN